MPTPARRLCATCCPILQQVELSDESYYKIRDYCQKKGITLLCSAFDSEKRRFSRDARHPGI